MRTNSAFHLLDGQVKEASIPKEAKWRAQKALDGNGGQDTTKIFPPLGVDWIKYSNWLKVFGLSAEEASEILGTEVTD